MVPDKGKPVARPGRKAMDLDSETARLPKVSFLSFAPGSSAMFARSLFTTVAAALVVVAAGLSVADEPTIVRIEEDREVIVQSPDEDTNAPQISTFLFPTDSEDVYFSFDLNHGSTPSYRSGGMQVQSWVDGYMDSFNVGTKTQILSGDGETITWTQVAELNGDSIHFSIINGNSETWDEFGETGSLSVVVPFDTDDLNGYSHTESLGSSGVGFAGNRVQSMKLIRVRKYTSAGLASTTSVNQEVESGE